MVVYLDLVMLLNFLVDGLLLLATNRLAGYPPGWKRVAWAAALGGIYAGICMLPQGGILGGTFFRVAVLAAMAVIAFGWNRSALRRGTVFVLLSMALGGMAQGLDGHGVFTLLLAAGAVVVLCYFGLKNPIGAQQYRSVELVWKGKCVCLTALVDTGNTLRDPITGAAVLVAGVDAAQKLGIARAYIEDPIAGLASGELNGARLIPYRAVGRANGMLLGVRCEKVRLNGRLISPLVAFAPEIIGKMDGYQALAGGI